MRHSGERSRIYLWISCSELYARFDWAAAADAVLFAFGFICFYSCLERAGDICISTDPENQGRVDDATQILVLWRESGRSLSSSTGVGDDGEREILL